MSTMMSYVKIVMLFTGRESLTRKYRFPMLEEFPPFGESHGNLTSRFLR